MVENIVAIELSYINTRHPDFQRATDTVASLYTNDRPQERKPSASQNSSKPAKNRPVQFANQPSPLANGDDASVTKVRGHPYITSSKGVGFRNWQFLLTFSMYLCRHCGWVRMR